MTHREPDCEGPAGSGMSGERVSKTVNPRKAAMESKNMILLGKAFQLSRKICMDCIMKMPFRAMRCPHMQNKPVDNRFPVWQRKQRKKACSQSNVIVIYLAYQAKAKANPPASMAKEPAQLLLLLCGSLIEPKRRPTMSARPSPPHMSEMTNRPAALSRQQPTVTAPRMRT